MVLTIVDPATTAIVATFLFVFAVVFALLSYTNIFVQRDEKGNPKGEPPRKVYAVIALVFGLFAAMYEPLVTGLQKYLPYASMLLIIIFIVIFAKRLFSGNKRERFDAFPVILSMGVLLLVLGIFWEGVALYLPSDLSSANALWVVGLIIIIGIFYAVHKHSEQSTAPTPATR